MKKYFLIGLTAALWFVASRVKSAPPTRWITVSDNSCPSNVDALKCRARDVDIGLNDDGTVTWRPHK